jgi:hypothetical protein
LIGPSQPSAGAPLAQEEKAKENNNRGVVFEEFMRLLRKTTSRARYVCDAQKNTSLS